MMRKRPPVSSATSLSAESSMNSKNVKDSNGHGANNGDDNLVVLDTKPPRVPWAQTIRRLAILVMVVVLMVLVLLLVVRRQDVVVGGGGGLPEAAAAAWWGEPYDGPPANLVVRGKRSHYAKVPETHRRKFWVDGKAATTMTRTFRFCGWKPVENLRDAEIFYRFRGARRNYYYEVGQPWQRYSRVPGISIMESKDGFLAGFRKYKEKFPMARLYFLPETYRLVEDKDKEAFQRLLNEGDGKNRPWVMKNVDMNNGRGIEMLGPQSKALETAVQRAEADAKKTYIVQQYICNELTWFRGEKFDLRMYWMVASVDPPIVLYHDGYVRIGAAQYDETDFSSTGAHLTNHKYRAEDQSQVTSDFLWKRVRQHYEANRAALDPKMSHTRDPVRHVRNQIKEALGTLVSAFSDVSFGKDPRKVTVENLFGFYGCDFILDADLDVWFVEVQASPGIGESYDYRIDMFRELLRPMIDIVEEIARKQQTDGEANLLPLESTQGWEIVYAGDWQYQYQGYERRLSQKRGCTPPAQSKEKAF